ncbi:MAG: cupin domain-containing protein [Streptosporangiaceae bacterium]
MDAKLISYQRPALKDGQPKAVKLLARSDRAFFAVQVVREGGENNLHSHAHVDGFWFVLSGRARFYTTGDELLGEFGPLEGVLVPREFPYWFESCGDDDLEILQFEASDVALGEPNADRTDHAPQKAWMNFGSQTANRS